MDKQPSRRSSLFLMELMIAILFFTLASTVCVRFFVKSHTLNIDSKNLSHAVSIATSTAEIFRTSENAPNILSQQFPEGIATDTSYRIYYDSEWQLCSLDNARYTVLLEIKQEYPFAICHIFISEEQTSIYELSIKKYIGLGNSVNENEKKLSSAN